MDPIEGPTTAEDRQGRPMSSRRLVRIIAGLCVLLSGCAQSGTLLSKGTNVGTLKTSLSHMEYENSQLRREVASLKSELRQTEDRLVQEESANGELSARLDNATAMLKRRGLDGSELADTGPVDSGSGLGLGSDRPRTTRPAGRPGKKVRKPPSAQIPGRLEVLSPPGGEDTTWNDPESPIQRDRPVVWLPVAGGVTDSTPARR